QRESDDVGKAGLRRRGARRRGPRGGHHLRRGGVTGAGRRRRRPSGPRPGSGTYTWFASGSPLHARFAPGGCVVGPGRLCLERAAVAPAGEGAADRAGAGGGTGAAAGAGAPAAAGRVGAEPWRRGVWVVRHALRTPEAIDGVIAVAREVGADALFVQVNGRM